MASSIGSNFGGITFGQDVASLRARRDLNKHTGELFSSMERLSTGLRINRPSDDAAGLKISAQLNVERRVLSAAIRNVNDGTSFLNVVQDQLQTASGMLIRMRELAVQASNDLLSDKQRQSLDAEAQALRAEYDRILEATSFNEVHPLKNSNIGATYRIQAGEGIGNQIPVTLATQLAGLSGDGTVKAPTGTSTAANPYQVAVADFNGDGIPDIVASGTDLQVRLGLGDGTFGSAATVEAAVSATSVQIGDFNDDGIADLVTGGASGGSARKVYLGNGNGTFQSGISYTAGAGNPFEGGLAVGDVNSDGKDDIAFSNTTAGTVSILKGNGDGTFQTQVTYGMGTDPTAVRLVDIDGDGNQDLLSLSDTDNQLSVRLGKHDGTFGSRSTYSVAVSPGTEFVVGDFDRDGKQDVVVSSSTGGQNLSLLRGNGDGTFQAAAGVGGTGVTATGITAADFDRDGKLDVAVSTSGTNGFTLFTGNGSGGFTASDSETMANARSIIAADLNLDGAIDIIAVNTTGSQFSVSLANTKQNLRIDDFNLRTRQSAVEAQVVLENVQERMTKEMGVIGAGLSRFSTASSNLRIAEENIASAESVVTEIDYASEAANMISAQIRRDAAIAVLGQANQTPQIALALLQS